LDKASPFDHIFVPVGSPYVPLNRRTRRVSKPRLVRFEHDRADTLYADFGTGIQRIVETLQREVS
jgi:hypothetical protein